MRVNLTRRGTLACIRATAAALLTVVVLAGCSVGMGKSPEQAKQSIVTFVEGSTDVVGDGWAARTSSSTFEAGAARWAHPTSARTPAGTRSTAARCASRATSTSRASTARTDGRDLSAGTEPCLQTGLEPRRYGAAGTATLASSARTLSAPADSAPTFCSAAPRASGAMPQFELGMSLPASTNSSARRSTSATSSGQARADSAQKEAQGLKQYEEQRGVEVAFDNGVSYDKPAYATLRGERIKITSVAYEHVE